MGNSIGNSHWVYCEYISFLYDFPPRDSNWLGFVYLHMWVFVHFILQWPFTNLPSDFLDSIINLSLHSESLSDLFIFCLFPPWRHVFWNSPSSALSCPAALCTVATLWHASSLSKGIPLPCCVSFPVPWPPVFFFFGLFPHLDEAYPWGYSWEVVHKKSIVWCVTCLKVPLFCLTNDWQFGWVDP